MSKSSTCGEFTRNCTTQTEALSKVHASDKNHMQADQFAESLRPVLLGMAARWKFKTCDLVREFNKHVIPAANGGKWHRTTIERLLKRLGEDFEAERRAAYDAAWIGKSISKSDLDKIAAAYRKSKGI